MPENETRKVTTQDKFFNLTLIHYVLCFFTVKIFAIYFMPFITLSLKNHTKIYKTHLYELE